MRILMLIPSLSGAGAERQLGYLATELSARGHEVLIGHLSDGPGPPPAGAGTHRFRETRAWSPKLVLEIIRLIREWRPDLVQTYITRMDVAGGIAARLTGVPFVLREPNSAPAYRDLRSKLRALVGRMADTIVANSKAGAALWPSARTVTIPNAVAAEAIAASTPVPHAGGEMVVYVGRLEPWKRVDVAITACAALMKERDLVLHLCGEGPDRARLEALVATLGVTDRVVFTGFIEKPWSHQRAADVALMLSDFEGHPNAVSEAFAAGTPMVLSEIPAHREIAGDDALFVPPGDVAATIDAIRATLDDPIAARERTARVSQRIHAWSVSAMTDAYETVYATILQSRRSLDANRH